METLPEPTDSRVRLVPLSGRRMLAIRFSGFATDGIIARKTSELRRSASDRNINSRGEPILAFYDPPWTLHVLRRNKIMLEIATR
jgi:hypothetical protein